MNSLSDLNNYGRTTLSFEDFRPAGIIFSSTIPVDQKTIIAIGATHPALVGINVVEIIKADQIDPYYIIDVSSTPGITVNWAVIPSGCVVTLLSTGVYKITFQTVEQWEIIRSPNIIVPNGFEADYNYNARIIWAGNQFVEWNVEVDFGVQLSILSQYTLNATGTIVVSQSAHIQALAGMTIQLPNPVPADPLTIFSASTLLARYYTQGAASNIFSGSTSIGRSVRSVDGSGVVVSKSELQDFICRGDRGANSVSTIVTEGSITSTFPAAPTLPNRVEFGNYFILNSLNQNYFVKLELRAWSYRPGALGTPIYAYYRAVILVYARSNRSLLRTITLVHDTQTPNPNTGFLSIYSVISLSHNNSYILLGAGAVSGGTNGAGVIDITTGDLIHSLTFSSTDIAGLSYIDTSNNIVIPNYSGSTLTGGSVYNIQGTFIAGAVLTLPALQNFDRRYVGSNPIFSVFTSTNSNFPSATQLFVHVVRHTDGLLTTLQAGPLNGAYPGDINLGEFIGARSSVLTSFVAGTAKVYIYNNSEYNQNSDHINILLFTVSATSIEQRRVHRITNTNSSGYLFSGPWVVAHSASGPNNEDYFILTYEGNRPSGPFNARLEHILSS
jgi:hypothetical protein